MLIFWRIRFFDRGTRTFNNRDLYLDTQELDAATRTAVEYIAESNNQQIQRKISDFRAQFKEGDWIALAEGIEDGDVPRWVGSFDYFEDENQHPISERELGPLLTGNPTAMMIPHGAKQHDIDLMLAHPEPIPLENISLTEKDIRTLAYFIRDLKELDESAFRKDGPGIIKSVGTIPSPQLCDPVLETGVTDDEIRSAVIIFRRFFMKGEPANFNKAVDVYTSALKTHPYAKWVDGVRNEFNSTLESPPDLLAFSQGLQITFTTRDLIEVFLYTQYAHQPDSKRETQYANYLEQVKGRKNFLTWLFLTEVWVCSLKIISAGRTIAAWFNRYCQAHEITPDVLASIRDDHKGIGTIEKKEAREIRLRERKIGELAKELWEQNGRPDVGYTLFLDAARQKIADIFGGRLE